MRSLLAARFLSVGVVDSAPVRSQDSFPSRSTRIAICSTNGPGRPTEGVRSPIVVPATQRTGVVVFIGTDLAFRKFDREQFREEIGPESLLVRHVRHRLARWISFQMEELMPTASKRAADQLLAERCVAGESAAWALLYDYFDGLVSYARTLLFGRAIGWAAPEDIVQDVFGSLCECDYQRLRAFDPARAPLHYYLANLVRERVRLLHLQNQRRREGEIPSGEHELIDPSMSESLYALQLHDCAGTLSQSDHEAFWAALEANGEPAGAAAHLSERDRKRKQRMKAAVLRFLRGLVILDTLRQKLTHRRH